MKWAKRAKEEKKARRMIIKLDKVNKLDKGLACVNCIAGRHMWLALKDRERCPPPPPPKPIMVNWEPFVHPL